MTIQVLSEEYRFFAARQAAMRAYLSTTRRQNPLEQHLPTHAGVWVPPDARGVQGDMAGRGGSPGNHSASPRCHHRTKASAHGQQKSGGGRGCSECHTAKGCGMMMINAAVTGAVTRGTPGADPSISAWAVPGQSFPESAPTWRGNSLLPF